VIEQLKSIRKIIANGGLTNISDDELEQIKALVLELDYFIDDEIEKRQLSDLFGLLITVGD